jgi:hypothetical protein
MMRLKARDLVATVLVALIAVPYIGYLVRGEVPFIQDARGMSATGLVLGIVAYLVMARGDVFDTAGWTETALAATGLALGVAALLLAETAAAELLLAVFMASIAVIWVVKVVDHMGLVHWHSPTGVAQ